MEVSLIPLIADFTSVCYNLIDKSGFEEVQEKSRMLPLLLL
nr:MAG TPA: hypothetical protein [Caudoviricetes sp.]